MKSRAPLHIEVVRGQIVESYHQVMAVIMDERGIVVGYWGNSDYLTLPRSSIKFLQAIPFVESGAIEKFGLDDKTIAMACSSHRGEKIHLDVLKPWMEKMNVNESVLACGPAMPAHEASANELIKKGQAPSRLHNNCSGKHLGFVSTSMMLNENYHDYHKIEHPCQARLRRVLSEYMKIQMDKMAWGIDGCGIPTHAIPLTNLATAMSAFISTPANPMRKMTLQKIMDACRKYPNLISGTDDFVSVVNEKTHGRSIIKSGAEGVYTGIMQEKGYVFALKVADGNNRAAQVASAFLLRYFGGLSEKEYQDLKQYANPDIKNTLDEKVGEVRVQKSATTP